MDDSRSIKNSEFTQMKKFIIDLVYRFNISREQTRVALVQFSSKKFTRVEFYLNQYYDKESLMNRINSLRQRDGGSTYTDHALRMARDQVFNGKNGDRPNVRDVIVLLTDGQSHDNDAAIAEARLLRDDDVSIISIGVGQGEEKEKLIKFLTSLSFGSDYVFKVSFANLETIIDGVTTAACENLQEM
ncbi:cartilage matrix protein-like [Xenia sp. Carnegie-2017]|uniref:cartilage matrix protein-like n=1 Tax=Xenia sp. Carnegie-2017 TaxID=2897299 RepID=UPI001F03D114|nr:cartilage matrix protein-like [Xenia sp. Carnegie-2017]